MSTKAERRQDCFVKTSSQVYKNIISKKTNCLTQIELAYLSGGFEKCGATKRSECYSSHASFPINIRTSGETMCGHVESLFLKLWMQLELFTPCWPKNQPHP